MQRERGQNLGWSSTAAQQGSSSFPSTSSFGGTRSGSYSEDSQSSRSLIINTPVGFVMKHRRDLPWGIRLIQKWSCCCPSVSLETKTFLYRVSILVITFFSYTAYHLSRKPISIVKNVLNQNCSTTGRTPPPSVNASDDTWCDWAPFNGSDSETLLGTLDSSFLFAYAAGMFVSGFIAERVNLRYFLSLGMLLSGFFTYLFGIAYNRKVHNLSYFILVQFLAGIFQTTGWPGVVTVVGNWFGKGKRGLIFGLWNSHTSLGNILGSLIAGKYVEDNWGLSFIVPGAIIGVMGLIVFLFLVPKPQHVGCKVSDFSENDEFNPSHINNSKENAIKRRQGYTIVKDEEALYEDDDDEESGSGTSMSSEEVDNDNNIKNPYRHPNEYTPIINPGPVHGEVKIKAIGFLDACKIPGVIEFSLCLFFAKLVSYTFLYWLPRYINNSTSFSPTESANLSTLFDVGGIIGGIIAGVISDGTGMSATTCAGMLSCAIPMLLVYQNYGAETIETNIILLIFVGILVNGPYALITTAVSTELGTHKSLKGNSRALATVTAIIDGTGSIGAAVGPLLAGPVSDYGWNFVFYMLMVADVFALMFIIRLVIQELKRFCEQRASRALLKKIGNLDLPVLKKISIAKLGYAYRQKVNN